MGGQIGLLVVCVAVHSNLSVVMSARRQGNAVMDSQSQTLTYNKKLSNASCHAETVRMYCDHATTRVCLSVC